MDSSHASQLPSIPVPFVVVEKVPDEEQPEYGHTEPDSLPSDAAKRTADAEPDAEEVRAEAPVAPEQSKSPEIPLLVVEKTDTEPAYGDDFGEDATVAQKVAHDMRAADATPDQVVISPDPESTAEEDHAAPLSQHGPIENDNPSLASSLEAMDEQSVHSSTEQTSSSEVINTPDESQNDDELSQGPLLPHETALSDTHDELENGLENGDADELESGPLLPHETGLNHDSGLPSDEEDEFDRAPLLSHETGFSNYKGSENTTNSGFLGDDDYMEPEHYGPYGDDDEGVETRTFEPDDAPTFSHEYDDRDAGDLIDGDDESPLLPHERDSAVISNAGSDLSADDAHYLQHGRPAFGYETDAQDFFRGSARPNIFRSRTNSSTLPHKLPRSDAEDENLDDPSLERFPTSREQILERVATIGLHLPEDETIEDNVHSPQMSVLSQACSSVDLVPVKSYTSLASVPEADDSDEEEDQDVESLPSPLVFNGMRSSSGFARDPHETPMPDDRKQLGYTEPKGQPSSARSAEPSEAESVDKHDGAKDSANVLSTLREAIATPTRVLNPITPPLTPENKTESSGGQEGAPESQLRQRREPKDDATQTPPTAQAATSEDTDDGEKLKRDVAPPLAQEHNKPSGTFFQNLTRAVVSSVGRFFAACAGDRKRAR